MADSRLPSPPSPANILVLLGDVGRFYGEAPNRGLALLINYLIFEDRKRIKEARSERNVKDVFGDVPLNELSHVRMLPDTDNSQREESLVLENLLRFCNRKKITKIVAPGVEEILFVSRHLKTLEKHGISSLVTPESEMTFTLDHKYTASLFYEKHGIPAPRTVAVHSNDSVSQKTARAFVRQCFEAGTERMFLKEPYGTSGGIGVQAVKNLVEYDDFVSEFFQKGEKISHGCGRGVHKLPPLIAQEGMNDALIFQTQSIFYKGRLVSICIHILNPRVADDLAGTFNVELAKGKRFGKRVSVSAEVVLSLGGAKHDLLVKSEIIRLNQLIGEASRFTGMCDIEYLVPSKSSDAGSSSGLGIKVLEINPRFSGACFITVGSGFLGDYWRLLFHAEEMEKLIAAGEDVDGKQFPRVRSDEVEPVAQTVEFDILGYYLFENPKALFRMRSLRPVLMKSRRFFRRLFCKKSAETEFLASEDENEDDAAADWAALRRQFLMDCEAEDQGEGVKKKRRLLCGERDSAATESDRDLLSSDAEL